MWKSNEKNMGYIFLVLTFALLGLVGVFLVPVVIFIIKISKRYPKVFTCCLFFDMYIPIDS